MLDSLHADGLRTLQTHKHRLRANPDMTRVLFSPIKGLEFGVLPIHLGEAETPLSDTHFPSYEVKQVEVKHSSLTKEVKLHLQSNCEP